MSTELNVEELTGIQKAAILLIAIGPEAAGETLKHLSDDEAEPLIAEMVRLEQVPGALIQAVVEDFYEQAGAGELIRRGGESFAQQMLISSRGEARATELLDKVQGRTRAKGFAMLEQVDRKQLIEFLRREHPQTIALILAHLSRDQAAQILDQLPRELQGDVVLRMARMDNISPEMLREVEEILETKLADAFSYRLSMVGGPETTADILKRFPPTTQNEIVQQIEEVAPEEAAQIRKQLFTFDDIRYVVPGRGFINVLRGINPEVIAVTLKGQSQAVREKIFANSFEARKRLIREEEELIAGQAMNVEDVAKAQEEIIARLKEAEEKHEIVIMRPGTSGVIL